MNFNSATAMSTLATLLRGGGLWKVGDGVMPEGVGDDEGYGIVEQIPGGSSSGGMAGNMEMATLIFQVKTVGRNNEQCRLLRQKFYDLLDDNWASITGCMGPPRVAPGGIVANDQRTFESNDTVYMEVTG